MRLTAILIFLAGAALGVPAMGAAPAGTQADPLFVKILSGAAPVDQNNALPVYGPKAVNTNAVPLKVGLVPTSISLTAGVCVQLIGANPNRNSLRWQVTGSNSVSISPGGCPLVAPMSYGAPYASGQQGGGDTFVGELSIGQFSAQSANGTNVSVWEGQ